MGAVSDPGCRVRSAGKRGSAAAELVGGVGVVEWLAQHDEPGHVVRDHDRPVARRSVGVGGLQGQRCPSTIRARHRLRDAAPSVDQVDGDVRTLRQPGGDLHDHGCVGRSAGPIDTVTPGGTLYQVGGFTFSWGTISSDTNQALSCIGSLCTDTRALQIQGTVSGNGFDATEFAANWTSNGACAKAQGSVSCVAGTYSASWSSSVVALGTPPVDMPTPGVLLLMSAGLLGLAYQRRRKA